jgi:pimeloyl-ACP methyl ester carboxylesterase
VDDRRADVRQCRQGSRRAPALEAWTGVGTNMGVEPRERRIAGDGPTLRVRDWQSDGPPIVLVHGLSSNSRIWDDVAARLAERYRVVALDQRGHGLSDRPTDGYGFDKMVGDLLRLIDALELERPALVGHSWGGNVALELAARHPDVVRALVLVDGGFIELSAQPGRDWDSVRVDLAPPDLTHLTFAELLERARNGDAARYWSPTVEATLRTSFRDGPDGRIRPSLRRDDHLEILRALWDQRPSELFPRIVCPTLIVPARRSDATGRAAEMAPIRERLVANAAAAIQNGRLLWMEETVHDVPLQRPAELAEAIESVASDR